MDVTKPYKFIGFGAMDVTKPYKFIGFGDIHHTKPYKFIGFGALPTDGHIDGQTLLPTNEYACPAILRWRADLASTIRGGKWVPRLYST